MNFPYSHITILGAGVSGMGAAELAAAKGISAFLSDGGKAKPGVEEVLEKLGIGYEFGGHSHDRVLDAPLMVKSPGIPDHAPIVQAALSRGIEVISEIEFAFRFTQKPIVAITGSNGKTTTTLLIHHMLKNAGMNAGLGGNIGTSLAGMVAQEQHDIYVVEVSSFQLDGINSFKPKIAICLNISPDHLDRYNYNMAEYRASKMRIAAHQDASDYFIYCADDEEIAEGMAAANIKSTCVPFSLMPIQGMGASAQNDQIFFKTNTHSFTMSINELALQGKHNLHNSMAAGLTGQLLELRKEAIRESLTDFKSVEHRLEPVISVHGIDFINDSKATNVNATWYALESMNRPIVWICGGVDKGNDYSQLRAMVADKVKAIVCLGKENDKIIQAFGDVVDIMMESDTMESAVRSAYAVGKKGDAVLLSPACASFDLFESYEDRGNQFKDQVYKL